MNIIKLKGHLARFNSRIRTIKGGGYIRTWLSLFWCYIRFGSSPDDYFRYEFYKKSDWERNKFLTYKRNQRLIKKYNDKEYFDIALKKDLFNEKFSEYIRREWLLVNERAQESLFAFIKKHQKVIFKPVSAGRGIGIELYQWDGKENPHSLFKRYKGYIAEQYIEQHPRLKELNPSSVNTVRVSTLLHKNTVHVIGCALKLGAGNSIVDNWHFGGMGASIDINYGVVLNPAVNEKLEKFAFHPYTNKQIIGFKVPNWDILIATVKQAAKEVPQLGFLGWDFAILQSGVELIEANHDPGHDVIQVSDLIGKFAITKAIQNAEGL